MHGSRVHEDAAHSFRIFCRVSICWTARITRWLRSLSGIWILRRSSRCLISVHGNSRRTDRDRRWINSRMSRATDLRFFLWIFDSRPMSRYWIFVDFYANSFFTFVSVHFINDGKSCLLYFWIFFFFLIDLINAKEKKKYYVSRIFPKITNVQTIRSTTPSRNTRK